MAQSKRNDGKQLESVIAHMEGLRLPVGWTVTPRKLMPSKSGGTVAELDIVISGKVGTKDFSWLIECRDRPRSKAPASWIEQLATRKSRFNLSCVTAVSTSGFSPGAIEVAQQFGIDLREFKQLTAGEFSCWPELSFMPHRTDIVLLHTAGLEFESFASSEIEGAVHEKLAVLTSSLVLKSATTDADVTPHTIFMKVLDANPVILKDLEVNGPALPVNFRAHLQGDNRYLLETRAGPIPVVSVVFNGSVQRSEELQPLVVAGEYLHTESRASIARIRTFAPQALPGIKLQTEIHESMDEEGVTFVLRSVENIESTKL